MPSRALTKILQSYRKRGAIGVLSHAALDASEALGRKLSNVRDHAGRAYVRGTPGDKDKLIVVLAGYKRRLWPLTLRRLHRYAPKDADVCVVTPGKAEPELAAQCSELGWIYAWTKENKTGLALNKAIGMHPQAEWVFKLDEDVFVSNGFFEDLLAGYQHIAGRGRHEPGFCAPTLNVNGVSYLTFLDKIGKSDEYRQTFGELRSACGGVRAHYDPEAALWLWRNSLPFDEVAQAVRTSSGTPGDPEAHLIGSRFSIGAILLRRQFLDQIGGFRSSWRNGILGVDESHLCAACVENSRPMFYLGNVLAGHFSFYPQEKAMLAAWPELSALDPETFCSVARP